MYNSVSKDLVIIAVDIPVTTDGRELCLMARLVQRAGKWFSSSLALGTDVVADITDRLPSDIPCYHDRARCHRSFYFNPHGGPITHSSTGSEPRPPVYPFSEVPFALGFVCCHEPPSERWSNPGALNPFSHSVQLSIVCPFSWNFLLYLHIFLAKFS